MPLDTLNEQELGEVIATVADELCVSEEAVRAFVEHYGTRYVDDARDLRDQFLEAYAGDHA